MLDGLRSLDIFSMMEISEEENNKNPEVQVFNCYMRMVMEMMNPNARNKFFLIAPEHFRLVKEVKEMARETANDDLTIHHHPLTASVISREEENIEQLLTTMENISNPFSQQCDQLFNRVTKAVMPDQVKEDLMEQTDIGQDLFGVFVKDRIQRGTVKIWESMKKRKLKPWKTVGNMTKIVGTTQTVELREDRNLFAGVYY